MAAIIVGNQYLDLFRIGHRLRHSRREAGDGKRKLTYHRSRQGGHDEVFEMGGRRITLANRAAFA